MVSERGRPPSLRPGWFQVFDRSPRLSRSRTSSALPPDDQREWSSATGSADYFVGREAEKPLRARVPAGNEAVKVVADDGVCEESTIAASRALASSWRLLR